LAERLVRLREYDKQKDQNALRLSEECLYLYSPIAHRLGIRKIYTEMEDIAFKYIYPEDYSRLKILVEKRRHVFDKKLMDMLVDIKTELKKSNIQASLQYRVKRLYSIYLKLKNKNVGIDEIFDLMALRIVTTNVENCYLALGIIHKIWIPIEGRFRDWVNFPKPNGYRSIQTTIINRRGDKFEVQIRTDEMHKEAEYGSAAHWAYKEGLKQSDIWIMELREFLENDEYFSSPYTIIEKLKSEVKRDSINVLTPKGEIVSLPVDSSPVDFSYAIHTQLGNQTTGARVNGKLVKLTTSLRSGDVVEVISNKNAKPSRDWLRYVKTSKARSKILLWIKKNESEQIIFEGKRTWEKFKKEYKKKLEGFDDEQSFRNGINKIGYKSSDDFFSSIGINSLKCSSSLLRKIYPAAFRAQAKLSDGNLGKRKESNLLPSIKVEGVTQIETRLAKCCNPIKGENIIAYITKNQAIKIHSENCQYLKSIYFDEERFKKAQWINAASLQKVKLKLIGFGFNEMLSSLVEKATDEKISILKTERINTKDRSSCILAEVEIRDIEQLKTFTGKLKATRSIEEVKVF
jgi:GTP pyrophosphokinase